MLREGHIGIAFTDPSGSGTNTLHSTLPYFLEDINFTPDHSLTLVWQACTFISHKKSSLDFPSHFDFVSYPTNQSSCQESTLTWREQNLVRKNWFHQKLNTNR